MVLRRIFATLLVALLLMPSVIKFAHIFEHHDHTLCEINDSENFHECEVDCPFLKFNLHQYYLNEQDYDIFYLSFNNFEVQTSIYYFFYNNKKLSFSLRAPPLVLV